MPERRPSVRRDELLRPLARYGPGPDCGVTTNEPKLRWTPTRFQQLGYQQRKGYLRENSFTFSMIANKCLPDGRLPGLRRGRRLFCACRTWRFVCVGEPYPTDDNSAD